MKKYDGTVSLSTTGTTICPYKRKDHQDFEKFFSTRNGYNAYESVTGMYVKTGEEKTGMYLTHRQSSDFLRRFFPYYDFKSIKENVHRPIQCEFSLNDTVIPTDIQYDILNKLMKVQKYPEWFVHLQGGFGKTLLSIQLMTILNMKTLIMCYSTTVLRQWIKTVGEKTTFNKRRILLIDASEILDNIYESTFNIDAYDIFMVTPKLLTQYCERRDYRNLNEIFIKMGIGLKVFDEAHRNLSNIVKINACTSVAKTLYLSADFAQSDHDKQALYYRMFHGVPIIRPDEKVMEDMSYIAAIVVYYNSHPSQQEYANVFTNHGFNGHNYMRYQLSHPKAFTILDKLFGLITTARSSNHRVLILVNLIEHVDMLYEYIKERYGDKCTVGKFHSGISEEGKTFAKDNADIIVSTYQSFGVGVDALGIRYVISINQCSKVDDNQAARRARPQKDGSECFYFMLVDRGFKYGMKKLKERLSYLKETKIKRVIQVEY